MSNAGRMYVAIAAGLHSEFIGEVFPEGTIVVEGSDLEGVLFGEVPQVINMDYRLLAEVKEAVDRSYYHEKPARRSGQKTRPHWPNHRRRK